MTIGRDSTWWCFGVFLLLGKATLSQKYAYQKTPQFRNRKLVFGKWWEIWRHISGQSAVGEESMWRFRLKCHGQKPWNQNQFQLYTLLEINISHPKALLKMIFLFARLDMLVPWRVDFCWRSENEKSLNDKGYESSFLQGSLYYQLKLHALL